MNHGLLFNIDTGDLINSGHVQSIIWINLLNEQKSSTNWDQEVKRAACNFEVDTIVTVCIQPH